MGTRFAAKLLLASAQLVRLVAASYWARWYLAAQRALWMQQVRAMTSTRNPGTAQCGTRIAAEIPKPPDTAGKSIMWMGAAFGKFHILEWEPFQEKWRQEMRPCLRTSEECS